MNSNQYAPNYSSTATGYVPETSKSKIFVKTLVVLSIEILKYSVLIALVVGTCGLGAIPLAMASSSKRRAIAKQQHLIRQQQLEQQWADWYAANPGAPRPF